MNTRNIIDVLNMFTTTPAILPATLIGEVADALQERDELREDCKAAENERDALRAALSAIVNANATMSDMSQPLEDARRMLEDTNG